MMLNHTFQDSAMLATCDYDTDSKELTVTFNNGRAYTYVDVSKATYAELIAAPSAGRYFNSIKSTLVQK